MPVTQEDSPRRPAHARRWRLLSITREGGSGAGAREGGGAKMAARRSLGAGGGGGLGAVGR